MCTDQNNNSDNLFSFWDDFLAIFMFFFFAQPLPSVTRFFDDDEEGFE